MFRIPYLGGNVSKDNIQEMIINLYLKMRFGLYFHRGAKVHLERWDAFFEEILFILHDIEKKTVSAGIRTTCPLLIGWALYRWATWLVEEWVEKKDQKRMSLFPTQSAVRTCLTIAMKIYCERFQTKCCVQIATVLERDICLWQKVTRILHQKRKCSEK